MRRRWHRAVRTPVTPVGDAGNVRERTLTRDPCGDVDGRLLAFAEHAQRHLRAFLEDVLPGGGGVLATHEDRDERESGMHRPDDRCHVRPLLGEHDRDADALRIGWNPRDDLGDRQPVSDEQRVRPRMPRQWRFAERIDHADVMAGRLERGGDVGRSQRGHDPDAVGVQRRDRRGTDQRYASGRSGTALRTPRS